MIWIILILLWILVKLKLTQRKAIVQANYKNKQNEDQPIVEERPIVKESKQNLRNYEKN